MKHAAVDFDLPSEVKSLLRSNDLNAGGRSSTDAIDDLQRLERCIARLEAVRADLLVEAADPVPRVEEFTVESADGQDRRSPRLVQIEDAVREEIAAALRWSPSQAGMLIEEARQLHAHLPATLAALRSGVISGRHASVVAEWSRRLSARDAAGPDAGHVYSQMCAAFEERVLRVARRGTVAQTRAAAKRTLASLDAAGARLRREQQRCTREVAIIDESDGISVLLARMSTPAARAVMESVGKEAALIEDGSLSAGERRAQALARLVLGGRAPQVRLDVVVPAMGGGVAGADSLNSAESSDSANSPNSPNTPNSLHSMAELVSAMVDGLDHATIDRAEIDADELRELLADPAVSVTMRKLVADPVTGVLSACGRSTYRVPARLREFIVRRDGTCRFPGCGRAARSSQIDHAEAWDDGGSTDPDNLGALCTRHHQLKTHAGWRLDDSRADGACTWISPHGRRYRHQSPSVVEVTLEQQFANVVAAALSAGHSLRPSRGLDHPPERGHPPGRDRPWGRDHPFDLEPALGPAIHIDYCSVSERHRREPDPPF